MGKIKMNIIINNGTHEVMNIKMKTGTHIHEASFIFFDHFFQAGLVTCIGDT